MKIAIITTRHWAGDARLARHMRYLDSIGHATSICSSSDLPRFRSLWSAIRSVTSVSADALIFPDPDFFAIGAFVARLRRMKPVIDIHEDYPKVASNRTWIPRVLRPLVSILARLMVAVGRMLSWKVIVAAPELSRSGDIVVLNTPNPGDFDPGTPKDTTKLVYVGDITVSRGALDMVEVLDHLADDFELVLIGPSDATTRAEVMSQAEALGLSARVAMQGRMDHEEAWREASTAQYGLSLLHDVPAYRDARATKLWEYMAAGIIPIVSSLPGQAQLVSQVSPALVCRNPVEVADLVRRLAESGEERATLVDGAVSAVRAEWDSARPDIQLHGVFEP